MTPTSRIVIIVAIVAAAAGGGYLWWQHQHPIAPPAAPAPVTAPAPVPPPPPPPPRPAPAAPAVHHPLATTSHEALPGLDDSDGYIKKKLLELLHRRSGLTFLVLDGFARRFVATVNNLATDNAASQSWPVKQTPGAFQADAPSGTGVISPQNSARYAPFVDFVDAIDTRRAVGLYIQLYPLLQKAYEDLGFPGKYFNDRVIEVIDNLLATPEVSGPIKVKVAAADGAAPPAGAARLYVYADPALESATAGQKILLRMGADNARRLKAKLKDVRRRLLESGPAPAAH